MTDAMFDEVSRCRQVITRLQRERDEVLEAHAAQIYRLRQEIERLTLNGIHSCHAECQRPVCRLTRERDALLEALRWIDKRCPQTFMDCPLHTIHREMAHDAGACARAAIKQAEGETNGQA